MKMVKLAKTSKIAIVDDDVFVKLPKLSWRLHPTGHVYARTHITLARNKYKSISYYLHHFVVPKKEGMDVDHINGDLLDNRLSNLRLCSHSENLMNRGKTKKNTSGFKGVHWAEWAKAWRVMIKAFNKQYSIGYFKDKKDAARAYNEAAKKYHGEFAYLNRI